MREEVIKDIQNFYSLLMTGEGKNRICENTYKYFDCCGNYDSGIWKIFIEDKIKKEVFILSSDNIPNSIVDMVVANVS